MTQRETIPANRATQGAGIGGAVGSLIVFLGPQWGLFEVTSASDAAMLTGALATTVAYFARYLGR